MISIWASIFLLILALFHTYQTFNQYGIKNNSFLLGVFVSVFFVIDIFIMYYFFGQQIITIDPENKTITMEQTNKIGSTTATIDFDKIKHLSLAEIEKNHYDIQITLKNNQVFFLFAFGDYCPKDKENISKQLEIIKQAISYNNNFFFSDNIKK